MLQVLFYNMGEPLTMTNQESYDSFKESCSDKVGEVMRAHALERRAVYEKRKESADKEYRLRYTEEKLPFIFPGLSWWLFIALD